MSTREAWLDAGLVVLAEQGVGGLHIDALAVRLGLTKGSFYHHFAGISGYRLDLLDHYERVATSSHIEQAEGDGGSPRARLERLRASVVADAGRPERAALDAALRSWASQDDDARSLVERVDRRRLDYLSRLWGEAGLPPERAADLARGAYLLLVGGHLVVPPITANELDRLLDLVLDVDLPG